MSFGAFDKVSIYSEKLAHLKKEIAIEAAKRRKKKKKFTANQTIIINFINGVTDEAKFLIKNMTVLLEKGDEKKGFMHILISHYNTKNGNITMSDIINFDLYLERAIKLNEYGVSNQNLEVYQYINGTDQYKIVLKKKSNNLVVTFYSVG